MVLKKFAKGYRVFNGKYAFLFNSYYNTLGSRVQRKNRGLLSRPAIKDIFEYRSYVDQQLNELLDHCNEDELRDLVFLGIQHEEQHQELLQTDIKYSLSLNPINLSHYEEDAFNADRVLHNSWEKVEAGIYEIGFDDSGFCFDNELNRHKIYLEPFEIAQSLVRNKEFIEFIDSGGYFGFFK